MIKKIFFLFSVLSKYKKKIIKVTIFEIFYSLILGRFFYKIYNDEEQADAMPCVYYFLYKISKFVKKKSINYIVDLGSGNGRAVNYLSLKTSSKVKGYEKNKEIFDYSLINLSKRAEIEHKDINLINFNELNADCFIVNTPFWKDTILKNLIDKIFSSNILKTKKYYIVIINTDIIIKNISLDNIFMNFNLIKYVNAGPERSLRIYESKNNE